MYEFETLFSQFEIHTLQINLDDITVILIDHALRKQIGGYFLVIIEMAALVYLRTVH